MYVSCVLCMYVLLCFFVWFVCLYVLYALFVCIQVYGVYVISICWFDDFSMYACFLYVVLCIPLKFISWPLFK